MARTISNKVSCLTVKGKEIGSIWLVEVVITIAVNDINTFEDVLITSDITTVSVKSLKFVPKHHPRNPRQGYCYHQQPID